jgi:ferric-dicitrate binding protein FerR (iron transport regulator)
MPDIKDMEAYIVRYLHEEIADEEFRELELWLQETPENREDFFCLKNIHDLTHSHKLLSDEEVEHSWQKLAQKMTAKPAPAISAGTPKRIAFSNRILQYVAVAAVAFAISFGAGKYLDSHSRSAEKNASPRYNEISVQKGGKPNTVNLSDGSVVRLNASTTLRYPSDFSGNIREVYLDGEAYFEVAKDDDKPFIVRLKQQNITVRGTGFNVEAYHDELYNIVTLLEGSVSLESLDNNGLKINNITLEPNQKSYFDHTTGKVSVIQVDASLSNTWMQGEYRFKDEPLMLIVKRLENYYDVNIHLDDERLKNIRYTGTFSLKQNIHEVLRVINHEKQFRFRQTGNEIHISNK